MATTYQPYLCLPSKQERFQAIQKLLSWMYAPATNKNHCLSELHLVLDALRLDDATIMERITIHRLIEIHTLNTLQSLKTYIQKSLEAIFTGSDPSSPIPCTKRLISRESKTGEFYYSWVYLFHGSMNIFDLRELIILRCLSYMHGLNMNALIQCSFCNHFSLRRHPKGKTYCTDKCRWKAAARTRKDKQNG